MAERPSNIQSSQRREAQTDPGIVDGLRPQNGEMKPLRSDPAGKDTRNITKSTSEPGFGPKQAGL